MKKYVVVLTAFLLFCGDMLAKNGEVIFWGVPFECRKADLAAAIKAKWNNAIVVDERNGGNNLIWRSKNYPDENLSYEGFEVNSASAEFTQDDSLSRAYVGLVPQKKQNIFELYFLVKRYLEGKYGKPEADLPIIRKVDKIMYGLLLRASVFISPFGQFLIKSISSPFQWKLLLKSR